MGDIENISPDEDTKEEAVESTEEFKELVKQYKESSDEEKKIIKQQMQDVQLEEAPSDELPRTGESQTSLNVLIGLLISMIGAFVLIFSKRRT